MNLRILQWNVSYLEPVAKVASVIQHFRPDICLLQEMTRDYQGVDVAVELGRLLGMAAFAHYAPGGLPDGGIAQMSNAILSRYQLTRQRFVELGRRFYLGAEVQFPGGPVIVGTAHFQFHPQFLTSDRQLLMVKRLLAEIPADPAAYIFGGDLNAHPRSRAAVLLRRRLQHAGPALTQPSWTQQPVQIGPWQYDELMWRLDYLLYQGLSRPMAAQLMATEVSDHCPLVVDFECGPHA